MHFSEASIDKNKGNKHEVTILKDLGFALRQQIFGKVIDTSTGEAIPYCNIEVIGSAIGTSSNELGEFVLEMDSLPVKIVFSHLNYEKQVIEVTEYMSLNIQLTPLVNNLNTVVLSINEKNKYAYELAEKAFSKTRKLSDQKKYGRAFYRQKSKNGDEFSEFSEIIYDASYSVDGIEDWEILEGRYALKREKVNNSNFTFLSRILKAMQPDTDDLIFPLRFNIEKFYELKIIDILSSQDEEIAVIWFKPLTIEKNPTLEGEVYINTKTHEVLKIKGTVKGDNLKFIQFKEKDAYVKNYQLSYEMVFKKGVENDLLIDYIAVNHVFDYYKNDAFLTNVESSSNLSFFEHYKPNKDRTIRRSFWNKGSDWEALNKIGYNEKFWDDNPFVKRTPIEDEVIASFSKNNAFESIFLNSKEQIAFMQSNLKGDVFIEKFDEAIRMYNNYNPVEKVFLHTDKDGYVVGDDLWFNAYVVLGVYHNFSLASKVLNVDLINANNTIVHSQSFGLEDGRGQGNIQLPVNLDSGDYQLRAYTNWMRNYEDDFFFTKSIKLLKSKTNNIQAINDDEIDLQFFPEGGYSVIGLEGKISFKAIGSDGLGRMIKGRIINSRGENLAPISSLHQGMGFISLKPEQGQKYIAVLNDGSKYELPKIQGLGYTMLVDNLDSKNIKVKIQASNELINKPFYITGLINNDKHFHGKYDFRGEASIDFEIPKGKLPSGVMTLTLFDEQMRPWSERSLFINNKEELTIQTILSKSDFKERGKFELKLHVKDPYGAPLSTNLSIAVTDTEKVVKNKLGANVLTHLLLESDIKGNIENPASYFLDNKRSTSGKLDLVMSTNGWRKYNWQEIEKARFEEPNEFSFERGYSISGIATNKQGVPLNNRELKVIATSGELLNLYVTKTDADGSFVIENVTNAGKVNLAFNAYESDGDPIDTQVKLFDTDNGGNLPSPNFSPLKTYKQDKNIDNGLISYKSTPFFVYEDAEELDEVLVQADKPIAINELTKYSESLYGMKPDYTITNEDKTAGNILYHLGNIPGVAVDLSFNWVNFRGNPYGPLWIIDGMRLENEIDPRFGGSGRDEIADSRTKRLYYDKPNTSNVPLMVQSLDFSQVERVEILKFGSETAIYGPSGRYGVIIVYTKTGKPKSNNAFTSKHTIQGYAEHKEFYSPKYDVELKIHENPDNRTTLYWNPSVQTDKNGNATIVFYNSDITKSIDVDIQSLSDNGIPGVYYNTYKK